MTSGGSRNRSGPPADPRSGRSDSRNFVLTALPSDGYQGEAPKFPLMRRVVMRWEFEDKRKFQVVDEDQTEAVSDREQELWAWAWSTPQACAWSLEAWRWQTIAMWVRTFVICEGSDATAADKGSVHRFADQIGLTPAGLKENGWAIATEASVESSSSGSTPTVLKASGGSRSRMELVKDVG